MHTIVVKLGVDHDGKWNSRSTSSLPLRHSDGLCVSALSGDSFREGRLVVFTNSSR